MTHAFFKALMFLGAGSVIHGMHHEQDMRRMGVEEVHALHVLDVLRRMVGDLRHHSVQRLLVQRRDPVERRADDAYIPLGWIVWLVGTIAATCTAFYMTRLMAMTSGKGTVPRETGIS